MRCPTARRRRSSSVAPIPLTPASSTIFSSRIRNSNRSSARLSRRVSVGRTLCPLGPPMGQAAMVGGSLPHHAHQRHPAAAERCYRLRLFRQRRDDLAPGGGVSAQWTGDRWTAYANYTYIDAVYLTTFEEPSPFNPLADANGFIPITNGTPIAGIPKNTVKVGVDYA